MLLFAQLECSQRKNAQQVAFQWFSLEQVLILTIISLSDETDGTRLYGTCLTFYEPLTTEQLKSLSLPPKQSVYAPKCICVLSHWPFYSAFREWLIEIHRKVFHSKLSIPIEHYIINFVMQVPLPPPKNNFKIKFCIGDKWITLSRPPLTSLPLADVSVLLFMSSH
jgi:hypothetical protein